MLNPKQIIAARGMLGLTQNDLAQAAGVSPRTVIKIEDGDEKTSYQTVLQVHRTLKNMGVEFLGTTGVNLTDEYKAYNGVEGHDRFYYDLFSTVKEKRCEIRAIYPTLENFLQSLGIVDFEKLERLEQLRKYADIRCLLSDADKSTLLIPHVQCKTIAEHPRGPWSYVMFGDKTGFIICKKNVEFGYVRIKSLDVNLTHVNEFESLWCAGALCSPKLPRIQ